MDARKTKAKLATIALAIALVAPVGCDEAPSESSAGDFDEQRAKLKARLTKKKVAAEAKPETAPAAGAAAVEKSFTYDPVGLRDPFRSFLWNQSTLAAAEVRGPLEQFDVSQLSLVAVVWKTGNARALVEDPAGDTYIVAQGTRIGKNNGRVIKIDDNLVIVKETYVDFLGQETIKDVEMEMRGSQGGEI